MVAHNRRLDAITFTIEGVNYECQITEWKINPPQNAVGDKVYTFCPDGEFHEETDPEDWTLDLKWVTDWRANGLDRVLWELGADPTTPADFVLTNHPTLTGEAVRWTGQVYPVRPAAGGEARATEMSEITLTGVGDVPTPTYPVVP